MFSVKIRWILPPATACTLVAALLTTLFCGSAMAAVETQTQTCVSPKNNAVKKANSPTPLAGEDESGTNPNSTVDREWSAKFTISDIAPFNIQVTELKYKDANSDQWKTSTKKWQLKWGLRDKDALYDLPVAIKNRPVARANSPYLVPPDAGCTIFLYPGNNGQLGWRTVGVVGDSLVTNLFYDNELFNAIYPHGRLQNLLNQRQLRVEVAAHGLRRLANYKSSDGSSANTQAEYYMQDEFRGMAKYWLINKALVVALGSNDFFWYIDTPDPIITNLRTLQAHDKFINFLREVSNIGTCIVLVAPPVYELGTSRDKINWLYEQAVAGSIAGVNSDNLRLVNAASRSIYHPEWFSEDHIHLSSAGADAYAQDIVDGVSLPMS